MLWRSLTAVAEKTVKKGTTLYHVGKIKTRSYVDKDGNNKYITEILADTMLVLEKKQAGGNTYDSTRNTEKTQDEPTEAEEPGSGYRQKNDSNDAGPVNGDPFNDSQGGVQSEDDLPF